MNNRFFGYVALCLAANCNAAFALESHCEDEAQAVFNCRLDKSDKVVSVCKIGPELDDQQYLQYIFGEIGKPELVYPKEKRVRAGQFSFSRQYDDFAGYLSYDLTFINGRNTYRIYWVESSKTDGVPMEKSEISGGVNVVSSSGKSIDLSCGEDMAEDLMSAATTFVRNVKWVEEQ